jgi:hypothetical protein
LPNRCDSCAELGFTKEPGCEYEVTDDERIMKNANTWQYRVQNYKECISLCAADVNCVSVGFFRPEGNSRYESCKLKSSNAIQICTEAISENNTSGSKCSADNECKEVAVTRTTTSTTTKTTTTTATTTTLTTTSNSLFSLLLKLSIIYHFQTELIFKFEYNQRNKTQIKFIRM